MDRPHVDASAASRPSQGEQSPGPRAPHAALGEQPAAPPAKRMSALERMRSLNQTRPATDAPAGGTRSAQPAGFSPAPPTGRRPQSAASSRPQPLHHQPVPPPLAGGGHTTAAAVPETSRIPRAPSSPPEPPTASPLRRPVPRHLPDPDDEQPELTSTRRPQREAPAGAEGTPVAASTEQEVAVPALVFTEEEASTLSHTQPTPSEVAGPPSTSSTARPPEPGSTAAAIPPAADPGSNLPSPGLNAQQSTRGDVSTGGPLAISVQSFTGSRSSSIGLFHNRNLHALLSGSVLNTTPANGRGAPGPSQAAPHHVGAHATAVHHPDGTRTTLAALRHVWPRLPSSEIHSLPFDPLGPLCGIAATLLLFCDPFERHLRAELAELAEVDAAANGGSNISNISLANALDAQLGVESLEHVAGVLSAIRRIMALFAAPVVVSVNDLSSSDLPRQGFESADGGGGGHGGRRSQAPPSARYDDLPIAHRMLCEAVVASTSVIGAAATADASPAAAAGGPPAAAAGGGDAGKPDHLLPPALLAGPATSPASPTTPPPALSSQGASQAPVWYGAVCDWVLDPVLDAEWAAAAAAETEDVVTNAGEAPAGRARVESDDESVDLEYDDPGSLRRPSELAMFAAIDRSADGPLDPATFKRRAAEQRAATKREALRQRLRRHMLVPAHSLAEEDASVFDPNRLRTLWARWLLHGAHDALEIFPPAAVASPEGGAAKSNNGEKRSRRTSSGHGTPLQTGGERISNADDDDDDDDNDDDDDGDSDDDGVPLHDHALSDASTLFAGRVPVSLLEATLGGAWGPMQSSMLRPNNNASTGPPRVINTGQHQQQQPSSTHQPASNSGSAAVPAWVERITRTCAIPLSDDADDDPVMLAANDAKGNECLKWLEESVGMVNMLTLQLKAHHREGNVGHILDALAASVRDTSCFVAACAATATMPESETRHAPVACMAWGLLGYELARSRSRHQRERLGESAATSVAAPDDGNGSDTEGLLILSAGLLPAFAAASSCKRNNTSADDTDSSATGTGQPPGVSGDDVTCSSGGRLTVLYDTTVAAVSELMGAGLVPEHFSSAFTAAASKIAAEAIAQSVGDAGSQQAAGKKAATMTNQLLTEIGLVVARYVCAVLSRAGPLPPGALTAMPGGSQSRSPRGGGGVNPSASTAIVGLISVSSLPSTPTPSGSSFVRGGPQLSGSSHFNTAPRATATTAAAAAAAGHSDQPHSRDASGDHHNAPALQAGAALPVSAILLPIVEGKVAALVRALPGAVALSTLPPHSTPPAAGGAQTAGARGPAAIDPEATAKRILRACGDTLRRLLLNVLSNADLNRMPNDGIFTAAALESYLPLPCTLPASRRHPAPAAASVPAAGATTTAGAGSETNDHDADVAGSGATATPTASGSSTQSTTANPRWRPEKLVTGVSTATASQDDPGLFSTETVPGGALPSCIAARSKQPEPALRLGLVTLVTVAAQVLLSPYVADFAAPKTTPTPPPSNGLPAVATPQGSPQSTRSSQRPGGGGSDAALSSIPDGSVSITAGNAPVDPEGTGPLQRLEFALLPYTRATLAERGLLLSLWTSVKAQPARFLYHFTWGAVANAPGARQAEVIRLVAPSVDSVAAKWLVGATEADLGDVLTRNLHHHQRHGNSVSSRHSESAATIASSSMLSAGGTGGLPGCASDTVAGPATWFAEHTQALLQLLDVLFSPLAEIFGAPIGPGSAGDAGLAPSASAAGSATSLPTFGGSSPASPAASTSSTSASSPLPTSTTVLGAAVFRHAAVVMAASPLLRQLLRGPEDVAWVARSLTAALLRRQVVGERANPAAAQQQPNVGTMTTAMANCLVGGAFNASQSGGALNKAAAGYDGEWSFAASTDQSSFDPIHGMGASVRDISFAPVMPTVASVERSANPWAGEGAPGRTSAGRVTTLCDIAPLSAADERAFTAFLQSVLHTVACISAHERAIATVAAQQQQATKTRGEAADSVAPSPASTHAPQSSFASAGTPRRPTVTVTTTTVATGHAPQAATMDHSGEATISTGPGGLSGSQSYSHSTSASLGGPTPRGRPSSFLSIGTSAGTGGLSGGGGGTGGVGGGARRIVAVTNTVEALFSPAYAVRTPVAMAAMPASNNGESQPAEMMVVDAPVDQGVSVLCPWLHAPPPFMTTGGVSARPLRVSDVICMADLPAVASIRDYTGAAGDRAICAHMAVRSPAAASLVVQDRRHRQTVVRDLVSDGLALRSAKLSDEATSFAHRKQGSPSRGDNGGSSTRERAPQLLMPCTELIVQESRYADPNAKEANVLAPSASALQKSTSSGSRTQGTQSTAAAPASAPPPRVRFQPAVVSRLANELSLRLCWPTSGAAISVAHASRLAELACAMLTSLVTIPADFANLSPRLRQLVAEDLAGDDTAPHSICGATPGLGNSHGEMLQTAPWLVDSTGTPFDALCEAMFAVRAFAADLFFVDGSHHNLHLFLLTAGTVFGDVFSVALQPPAASSADTAGDTSYTASAPGSTNSSVASSVNSDYRFNGSEGPASSYHAELFGLAGGDKTAPSGKKHPPAIATAAAVNQLQQQQQQQLQQQEESVGQRLGWAFERLWAAKLPVIRLLFVSGIGGDCLDRSEAVIAVGAGSRDWEPASEALTASDLLAVGGISAVPWSQFRFGRASDPLNGPLGGGGGSGGSNKQTPSSGASPHGHAATAGRGMAPPRSGTSAGGHAPPPAPTPSTAADCETVSVVLAAQATLQLAPRCSRTLVRLWRALAAVLAEDPTVTKQGPPFEYLDACVTEACGAIQRRTTDCAALLAAAACVSDAMSRFLSKTRGVNHRREYESRVERFGITSAFGASIAGADKSANPMSYSTTAAGGDAGPTPLSSIGATVFVGGSGSRSYANFGSPTVTPPTEVLRSSLTRSVEALVGSMAVVTAAAAADSLTGTLDADWRANLGDAGRAFFNAAEPRFTAASTQGVAGMIAVAQPRGARAGKGAQALAASARDGDPLSGDHAPAATSALMGADGPGRRSRAAALAAAAVGGGDGSGGVPTPRSLHLSRRAALLHEPLGPLAASVLKRFADMWGAPPRPQQQSAASVVLADDAVSRMAAKGASSSRASSGGGGGSSGTAQQQFVTLESLPLHWAVEHQGAPGPVVAIAGAIIATLQLPLCFWEARLRAIAQQLQAVGLYERPALDYFSTLLCAAVVEGAPSSNKAYAKATDFITSLADSVRRAVQRPLALESDLDLAQIATMHISAKRSRALERAFSFSLQYGRPGLAARAGGRVSGELTALFLATVLLFEKPHDALSGTTTHAIHGASVAEEPSSGGGGFTRSSSSNTATAASGSSSHRYPVVAAESDLESSTMLSFDGEGDPLSCHPLLSSFVRAAAICGVSPAHYKSVIAEAARTILNWGAFSAPASRQAHTPTPHLCSPALVNALTHTGHRLATCASDIVQRSARAFPSSAIRRALGGIRAPTLQRLLKPVLPHCGVRELDVVIDTLMVLCEEGSGVPQAARAKVFKKTGLALAHAGILPCDYNTLLFAVVNAVNAAALAADDTSTPGDSNETGSSTGGRPQSAMPTVSALAAMAGAFIGLRLDRAATAVLAVDKAVLFRGDPIVDDAGAVDGLFSKAVRSPAFALSLAEALPRLDLEHASVRNVFDVSTWGRLDKRLLESGRQAGIDAFVGAVLMKLAGAQIDMGVAAVAISRALVRAVQATDLDACSTLIARATDSLDAARSHEASSCGTASSRAGDSRRASVSSFGRSVNAAPPPSGVRADDLPGTPAGAEQPTAAVASGLQAVVAGLPSADDATATTTLSMSEGGGDETSSTGASVASLLLTRAEIASAAALACDAAIAEGSGGRPPAQASNETTSRALWAIAVGCTLTTRARAMPLVDGSGGAAEAPAACGVPHGLHTADLAAVRASLSRCPIRLASAIEAVDAAFSLEPLVVPSGTVSSTRFRSQQHQQHQSAAPPGRASSFVTSNTGGLAASPSKFGTAARLHLQQQQQHLGTTSAAPPQDHAIFVSNVPQLPATTNRSKKSAASAPHESSATMMTRSLAFHLVGAVASGPSSSSAFTDSIFDTVRLPSVAADLLEAVGQCVDTLHDASTTGTATTGVPTRYDALLPAVDRLLRCLGLLGLPATALYRLVVRLGDAVRARAATDAHRAAQCISSIPSAASTHAHDRSPANPASKTAPPPPPPPTDCETEWATVLEGPWLRTMPAVSLVPPSVTEHLASSNQHASASAAHAAGRSLDSSLDGSTDEDDESPEMAALRAEALLEGAPGAWARVALFLQTAVNQRVVHLLQRTASDAVTSGGGGGADTAVAQFVAAASSILSAKSLPPLHETMIRGVRQSLGCAVATHKGSGSTPLPKLPAAVSDAAGRWLLKALVDASTTGTVAPATVAALHEHALPALLARSGKVGAGHTQPSRFAPGLSRTSPIDGSVDCLRAALHSLFITATAALDTSRLNTSLAAMVYVSLESATLVVSSALQGSANLGLPAFVLLRGLSDHGAAHALDCPRHVLDAVSATVGKLDLEDPGGHGLPVSNAAAALAAVASGWIEVPKVKRFPKNTRDLPDPFTTPDPASFVAPEEQHATPQAFKPTSSSPTDDAAQHAASAVLAVQRDVAVLRWECAADDVWLMGQLAALVAMMAPLDACAALDDACRPPPAPPASAAMAQAAEASSTPPSEGLSSQSLGVISSSTTATTTTSTTAAAAAAAAAQTNDVAAGSCDEVQDRMQRLDITFSSLYAAASCVVAAARARGIDVATRLAALMKRVELVLLHGVSRSFVFASVESRSTEVPSSAAAVSAVAGAMAHVAGAMSAAVAVVPHSMALQAFRDCDGTEPETTLPGLAFASAVDDSAITDDDHGEPYTAVEPPHDLSHGAIGEALGAIADALKTPEKSAATSETRLRAERCAAVLTRLSRQPQDACGAVPSALHVPAAAAVAAALGLGISDTGRIVVSADAANGAAAHAPSTTEVEAAVAALTGDLVVAALRAAAFAHLARRAVARKEGLLRQLNGKKAGALKRLELEECDKAKAAFEALANACAAAIVAAAKVAFAACPSANVVMTVCCRLVEAELATHVDDALADKKQGPPPAAAPAGGGFNLFAAAGVGGPTPAEKHRRRIQVLLRPAVSRGAAVASVVGAFSAAWASDVVPYVRTAIARGALHAPCTANVNAELRLAWAAQRADQRKSTASGRGPSQSPRLPALQDDLFGIEFSEMPQAPPQQQQQRPGLPTGKRRPTDPDTDSGPAVPQEKLSGNYLLALKIIRGARRLRATADGATTAHAKSMPSDAKPPTVASPFSSNPPQSFASNNTNGHSPPSTHVGLGVDDDAADSMMRSALFTLIPAAVPPALGSQLTNAGGPSGFFSASTHASSAALRPPISTTYVRLLARETEGICDVLVDAIASSGDLVDIARIIAATPAGFLRRRAVPNPDAARRASTSVGTAIHGVSTSVSGQYQPAGATTAAPTKAPAVGMGSSLQVGAAVVQRSACAYTAIASEVKNEVESVADLCAIDASSATDVVDAVARSVAPEWNSRALTLPGSDEPSHDLSGLYDADAVDDDASTEGEREEAEALLAAMTLPADPQDHLVAGLRGPELIRHLALCIVRRLSIALEARHHAACAGTHAAVAAVDRDAVLLAPSFAERVSVAVTKVPDNLVGGPLERGDAHPPSETVAAVIGDLASAVSTWAIGPAFDLSPLVDLSAKPIADSRDAAPWRACAAAALSGYASALSDRNDNRRAADGLIGFTQSTLPPGQSGDDDGDDEEDFEAAPAPSWHAPNSALCRASRDRVWRIVLGVRAALLTLSRHAAEASHQATQLHTLRVPVFDENAASISGGRSMFSNAMSTAELSFAGGSPSAGRASASTASPLGSRDGGGAFSVSSTTTTTTSAASSNNNKAASSTVGPAFVTTPTEWASVAVSLADWYRIAADELVPRARAVLALTHADPVRLTPTVGTTATGASDASPAHSHHLGSAARKPYAAVDVAADFFESLPAAGLAAAVGQLAGRLRPIVDAPAAALLLAELATILRSDEAAAGDDVLAATAAAAGSTASQRRPSIGASINPDVDGFEASTTGSTATTFAVAGPKTSMLAQLALFTGEPLSNVVQLLSTAAVAVAGLTGATADVGGLSGSSSVSSGWLVSDPGVTSSRLSSLICAHLAESVAKREIFSARRRAAIVDAVSAFRASQSGLALDLNVSAVCDRFAVPIPGAFGPSHFAVPLVRIVLELFSDTAVIDALAARDPMHAAYCIVAILSTSELALLRDLTLYRGLGPSLFTVGHSLCEMVLGGSGGSGSPMPGRGGAAANTSARPSGGGRAGDPLTSAASSFDDIRSVASPSIAASGADSGGSVDAFVTGRIFDLLLELFAAIRVPCHYVAANGRDEAIGGIVTGLPWQHLRPRLSSNPAEHAVSRVIADTLQHRPSLDQWGEAEAGRAGQTVAGAVRCLTEAISAVQPTPEAIAGGWPAGVRSSFPTLTAPTAVQRSVAAPAAAAATPQSGGVITSAFAAMSTAPAVNGQPYTPLEPDSEAESQSLMRPNELLSAQDAQLTRVVSTVVDLALEHVAALETSSARRGGGLGDGSLAGPGTGRAMASVIDAFADDDEEGGDELTAEQQLLAAIDVAVSEYGRRGNTPGALVLQAAIDEVVNSPGAGNSGRTLQVHSPHSSGHGGGDAPSVILTTANDSQHDVVLRGGARMASPRSISTNINNVRASSPRIAAAAAAAAATMSPESINVNLNPLNMHPNMALNCVPATSPPLSGGAPAPRGEFGSLLAQNSAKSYSMLIPVLSRATYNNTAGHVPPSPHSAMATAATALLKTQRKVASEEASVWLAVGVLLVGIIAARQEEKRAATTSPGINGRDERAATNIDAARRPTLGNTTAADATATASSSSTSTRPSLALLASQMTAVRLPALPARLSALAQARGAGHVEGLIGELLLGPSAVAQARPATVLSGQQLLAASQFGGGGAAPHLAGGAVGLLVASRSHAGLRPDTTASFRAGASMRGGGSAAVPMFLENGTSAVSSVVAGAEWFVQVAQADQRRLSFATEVWELALAAIRHDAQHRREQQRFAAASNNSSRGGRNNNTTGAVRHASSAGAVEHPAHPDDRSPQVLAAVAGEHVAAFIDVLHAAAAAIVRVGKAGTVSGAPVLPAAILTAIRGCDRPSGLPRASVRHIVNVGFAVASALRNSRGDDGLSFAGGHLNHHLRDADSLATHCHQEPLTDDGLLALLGVCAFTTRALVDVARSTQAIPATITNPAAARAAAFIVTRRAGSNSSDTEGLAQLAIASAAESGGSGSGAYPFGELRVAVAVMLSIVAGNQADAFESSQSSSTSGNAAVVVPEQRGGGAGLYVEDEEDGSNSLIIIPSAGQSMNPLPSSAANPVANASRSMNRPPTGLPSTASVDHSGRGGASAPATDGPPTSAGGVLLGTTAFPFGTYAAAFFGRKQAAAIQRAASYSPSASSSRSGGGGTHHRRTSSFAVASAAARRPSRSTTAGSVAPATARPGSASESDDGASSGRALIASAAEQAFLGGQLVRLLWLWIADKQCMSDARSLMRVARSLSDTESVIAQLTPAVAANFVEAVDAAACRFADSAAVPATPTVRHALRAVVAFMVHTLMSRARSSTGQQQQHLHQQRA